MAILISHLFFSALYLSSSFSSLMGTMLELETTRQMGWEV